MIYYELLLQNANNFQNNDARNISLVMSFLNTTDFVDGLQGNFSNGTLGSPGDIKDESSFRHLNLQYQILITFSYGFGITANVCALVLLAKGETARNRKQTLMVRCLAWNDLVALVGSFLLMYLQLYMGEPMASKRWFCALRVILRTFGLSSGCVATVMAAERWMALTRPFIYQKHVTHKLIKRAIFTLWLVALFLVCLPLTGFGLYFDENIKNQTCRRYRLATETTDKAYAFIVFSFGVILCLVIVCCNLAVVRVLCRMGKKSLAHLGRTTVRKDSRELAFNHTTPEEVSFAKLMVILCIFFIVCWVPQLITIVMAQVISGEDHPFYRLADIFMALNFTLDPVVYVLSRRPHRKGLRMLLKPLFHFCWPPPTAVSSLRSSQDIPENIKGSRNASRDTDSDMTKMTKEMMQNSMSNGSQKVCIVMDRRTSVHKSSMKSVVTSNKKNLSFKQTTKTQI